MNEFVGALNSPPEYGDAPLREDQDFVRAATWLKDPVGSPPEALILGVPFSSLSLSGARCDLLPDAVRRAMWTFSTFSGSVDLQSFAVSDIGNLIPSEDDVEDSLHRVRKVCESLPKPLAIIGGDNSITAPAMLGSVGTGGALITIDAHHDLRDYRRDGLSNGSPVRVLLDEGVDPHHVWQIGIRDFMNSKVYSDLARERGINVIRASEVKRYGIGTHLENALAELSAADGIYVDIDVDSVERALAPGAPAAQPGGLMPEDLTTAAFICGSDPNVLALDIVEVDPTRDVADATVRLAALILLNFLAGVASRSVG